MKYFFFTLCFLLYFQSQSQNIPQTCGSVEWSKTYIETPEFKQQLKFIQEQQKNLAVRNNFSVTDTIPVIVHVLWSVPAMNIPDSTILRQLEILNADFAKMNADTVNTPVPFKALAGSTPFRFALARRDQNGAFTTGIIRKQITHGEFDGFHDLVSSARGGDDSWNNGNFLNIYCCDLIPSIAGVAQFNFPLVAVDYLYWGLTPGFSTGRVATHEVGHSFGLQHVWGSETGIPYSCTSDDGIADTPPQYQPSAFCSVFPLLDQCTSAGDGIMFCNYMDYTDDACRNMFSQGQTAAMISNVNTYQPGLLTSNGLDPVKETDAGISAILCPRGNACTTFSPVVELRNWGTDILTSVTINYKLDTNTPLTYNWTGNLSNYQSELITLPAQTVAQGYHPFKVYTSSPNGLTDQDATNDTSRNFLAMPAALTIPVNEGFEGTVFPAQWGGYNPHGNGFMRSITIGHTGSASLYMDNGYDIKNYGDADDINTRVDLSNASNPLMTFYLAYTTSIPLGSTDTLEILASSDCGLTYDLLYKKYDSLLYTAPIIPFGTTFVPTVTQWRKDSVDLSAYAHLSNDVLIVFRDISAYGLELYFDDVNIQNTITGMDEPEKNEDDIILFPNPNNGIFRLETNENFIGTEVINSLGQIIFSSQNSKEKSVEINLPQVKGIYIINIKTTKGILRKRFVVE